MNLSFEKISKILQSGTRQEKIQVLELLTKTNDSFVIKKIVLQLDDTDIEIRGEAFSSLILNQNKISKVLIQNLDSESKNIRGFLTLILANRKDLDSISAIIDLTHDESAMVRACAVGALGYLKATNASKSIHSCLLDSNIEVRKSALKATIDIGEELMEEEINALTKENDQIISNLLLQVKKG